MSEAAVVVPLEIPIDMLARQIGEQQERAKRSDHDRIEASVLIALKLREARDRFPGNKEFGTWVKDQAAQGVFKLSRPDLAAFVKLGADKDLCREAFLNSRYRNPRLVWNEAKRIWPGAVVTSDVTTTIPPPPKPKKLTHSEARRMTKLGDNYEPLKSTTLSSRPEMDALIKLQDGFPGEAKALIARAKDGHTVSAAAVLAKKGRKPPPTKAELMQAWKHSHRIIAVWERADPQVRREFVEDLIKLYDRER
jgi:hypothetical protein